MAFFTNDTSSTIDESNSVTLNNINNLNSLKIFKITGSLLSFKKASEELNVTPTAISHQIKNLESELGYKLFIRKIREIELTEKGSKLLQSCSKAFAIIEDTLNELGSNKKEITVTTTSAFAANWLIPNLEDFYESYPDIEINILSSEKVYNLRKRNDIDFAIRFGPKPKDNIKILKRERFKFYISPFYESKALKKNVILKTSWTNKAIPEISIKNLTNEFKVKEFKKEEHAIKATINGQGILFMGELICENDELNKLLKLVRKMETVNSDLYYYLETNEDLRNDDYKKIFKNWLLTKFNKKGK